VERVRAQRQGDTAGSELGDDVAEWGIPTAVSVAAARTSGLPLIATGGVRSGVDAAKAIALGAHCVGVARPLLLAALEGDDAVDAWVQRFVRTLAAVHQLTGCTTPAELREAPLVVGGATRRWLDDLGWAESLGLRPRIPSEELAMERKAAGRGVPRARSSTREAR
jgi:isopentenyl-diphosphate delta-isomerase